MYPYQIVCWGILAILGCVWWAYDIEKHKHIRQHGNDKSIKDTYRTRITVLESELTTLRSDILDINNVCHEQMEELLRRRDVIIDLERAKGALEKNIDHLKRVMAARDGADTKRAIKVVDRILKENGSDGNYWLWSQLFDTNKSTDRRRMESLLGLRGKIDWDKVDR